MTWTNISSIKTDKDWFYSPVFTGNSIRIRHVLSVYPNQLPWRFYGLIAQVFNYPDAIELFNVRKLYPSNHHTVLIIPNPFPGRERRIAIRGQRRYQTLIAWTAFIDTWSGEIDLGQDDLQESIDLLAQDVQENRDLITSFDTGLGNEEVNEEIPPGYYF